MAIPEKFKSLANAVRDEIYGKDVREAIAKSIEETGESSETAIKITEQLIDGSFDEGILNTEIEQRLEQIEQEYAPELNSVKSQLAQTMSSLAGRGTNVKDYGAKGDGTTDDSQAIVDAANEGDGVVLFPPGTYIAQGLPLREGLHYVGSGMPSTELRLIDDATNHLFVSESEEINGGSIRSMELVGATSGEYSDYNGIDFSKMDRLETFTVTECMVRGFNIGFNGTDNDRWAYITNNRFWRNRIGIKGGEHPILVGNDIRLNDIGVQGNFNDFYMIMCKLTRNRIGVEPVDYINNAFFEDCAFFRNEELALRITSRATATSCRFVGNNSDDVGIMIDGTENIITDNQFGQQGVTFERAAVEFADIPIAQHFNTINNNRMLLENGAAILCERETSTLRYLNINGNMIKSNGAPFFRSLASDFSFSNINGNIINYSGDMQDSLISIPNTNYNYGIKNNVFVIDDGSSLDSIFKIDASRSKIIGNIYDADDSVVVFDLIDVRSSTEIDPGYGFKKTNNGTVFISDGETTHVVEHGLSIYPETSKIIITPNNVHAARSDFWVSNANSTDFTINVDESNPATLSFHWQIID